MNSEVRDISSLRPKCDGEDKWLKSRSKRLVWTIKVNKMHKRRKGPGALKEMQVMKIIPDRDFNSTLDHLLRHKV